MTRPQIERLGFIRDKDYRYYLPCLDIYINILPSDDIEDILTAIYISGKDAGESVGKLNLINQFKDIFNI